MAAGVGLLRAFHPDNVLLRAECEAPDEGTYRRGIEGIVIKPADWHRPTREEWEAMRDIVEQAVKKASGHS